MILRLRAAIHELRCEECRVTWKSWAQRVVGIKAGFSPGAHNDGSGCDPVTEA